MRYPNEQFGKGRVCPITGKQFELTWTDHSLLGFLTNANHVALRRMFPSLMGSTD